LKKKARILAWAKEGMPVKEITTRMGCHRSAIHRVVTKAKRAPLFAIPSRKKGSGRPRKLTSHVLGVVRRQIQKNLESTADLKTSCLELDIIDEQTISHALQKHQNMPSTVVAMKPLLSTKMKKKRLQFAQKYKTWRVADWSKVMYSDRLTFCCIRSTKRKARSTIPQKMP
jgi:transposase